MIVLLVSLTLNSHQFISVSVSTCRLILSLSPPPFQPRLRIWQLSLNHLLTRKPSQRPSLLLSLSATSLSLKLQRNWNKSHTPLPQKQMGWRVGVLLQDMRMWKRRMLKQSPLPAPPSPETHKWSSLTASLKLLLLPAEMLPFLLMRHLVEFWEQGRRCWVRDLASGNLKSVFPLWRHWSGGWWCIVLFAAKSLPTYQILTSINTLIPAWVHSSLQQPSQNTSEHTSAIIRDMYQWFSVGIGTFNK